MPDPEGKENKELSNSESVIFGFKKETKDLFLLTEKIQVESIINELVVLINPSDLGKKNDLVNYICSGKLGSKEKEDLEKMADYIVYGSYENIYAKKENPGARKLKYILDNYGRNINTVLIEIRNKEQAMKPKPSPKPKEEKKEGGVLEGALGRLKDAYNYGADKLSDLWHAATKLIPTGIKNWVKDNLFSPEHQQKTEAINDLHQKLEGPEKPGFLPFYLAMQGYNHEKDSLRNTKYLTIVDYSKPVSQNRLYVINMDTMTVENCVQTGHGKNSGNTQTTSKFSNIPNSNQTSIGFFRTPASLAQNSKRTWKGLFLKGLEYSNDKANARGIAVHPVQNFFYSRTEKGHKAGDSTSEGCITIRTVDNPNVIMNKIKGDSLIYSYYPDITYLNKSTMIK